MAPNRQLSSKAQQSLQLPDGFRTYSPYPFTGLNIQATPLSVSDSEFIWLENFVHIGDGKLRTIWDVGAAIYEVAQGQDIVYVSFFTIGSTYYVMIFLSGGTAVQLQMSNLQPTYISPALPFYLASTGNLPVARQWGTQYLLIANNNTPNDYWAWDGTLLYFAGSAAPGGVNILSGGSGYSSTPTLTIFGGHGSGISVEPVISGGQIVEFNITSPGKGFQPGDIVQIAAQGGGADDAPILVAALAATTVAGVTVTAPGSGYTHAAVAFMGGGGTGAAATVTIVAGQITAIIVSNPGSGYTSAPSVVITGDGSNAEAVSVLTPSTVASVTVDSGGSGFISVPLVTFVGGGGAGATGVVNLTPTGIAAINVSAGGSGYTSAPTITFIPAGGGAAATANISGGQVTSVTVTSPGSFTSSVEVIFAGGAGTGAGGTVQFEPTSIASVTISSVGQFYTDAPAVEVSSGANGAAYATIDLMPFGVSGSDFDTWQSRVWIFDSALGAFQTTPAGGNWQVSAPGSFIDFATSDGGVQALNTDSFLQTRYTAARQSSGYLYAFGDGSVSVITSVTTQATSGSPPTVQTSYVYQNVDPQAGAAWRDSVQAFGRSLITANETGIYGLYGGTLSKISAKLDDLFDHAIFPPAVGAVAPSSAISFIHAVKHYHLLMTVRDPDTLVYRNVLVTWNDKDWTILSQTTTLKAIYSQKIASNYIAWGTDGLSLFPLFHTPSATLEKRFDTKQYGADRMFVVKQALTVHLQMQDESSDSSGVQGVLSAVASGLAVQNGEFPTAAGKIWGTTFENQPAFVAPYPFWPLWGTSMGAFAFVSMGLRFSSTSPDFILGNVVIGYKDYFGYFGQ